MSHSSTRSDVFVREAIPHGDHLWAARESSHIVNVAAVTELQHQIEDLWVHRDSLDAGDGAAISVVREAIDSLDRGEARFAEISDDGTVIVHEWLEMAILLLFQQAELVASEFGPD